MDLPARMAGEPNRTVDRQAGVCICHVPNDTAMAVPAPLMIIWANFPNRPFSYDPAAMNLRIGHGHDLHRLQTGGKLLLGGVVVSESMSPIAHSDGDVVIHALVDALLGAVGAGDIGDAFPNTDPQWKGAASTTFLKSALAVIAGQGYSVVNADILIQAERPKLGALKPAIAANLADLLGAPVNVKAGTNEGCDAIGRGEALAATVVVLLKKD